MNRLIEACGDDVGLSMLLVDFKNAFNLVDREVMLHEVCLRCPAISRWVEFCYSNPARLYYGEHTLWSCQGVQQGDPLGPLLFSLVLHPLICKIRDSFSLSLHAWYLDDGTIVGDTMVVGKTLEAGLQLMMKRVAKTIRLMNAIAKINDPQCELLLLRSCAERIVNASRPGFGYWQWRLATLPFVCRGFGVYCAGDVLNYAFLASRLQSAGLQTKLLRHTGIVSPGPIFDDALSVFNIAVETDLLCNPKSTFSLSPRQMALWTSQREDHTSNWLMTVPISGLGQTMNGFIEDIYGDHAVSCVGIIGIKHRHNVMRDTLVNICYRSSISAGKEVDIGLNGRRDKSLRLADMLLYSWDEGLDVCVDLTGSSPLTQTGMVDFVPGRAVFDAAQRKHDKYMAKCAAIGYGFLPFSFSYFGKLEADAVTLLKRIRKFFMAQNIGARAAVHIFNRISFTIAKGVGAQIVSRLPSNLLLVSVLGDIVNEVQSSFIADRQILDGLFILNEVMQWCKIKKKQSLVFKVDFEKAYDSVRWDFLDDILKNFGLKQWDPLSPFLFILIMESLHLSFQRVVDAGMFKSIKLSALVNISHMFYVDDAVFVGQWCDSNITTLTHVLECFYRVSGLRINMSKSKITGVHVDSGKVKCAAMKLGCLILKTAFSYLGSTVGGSMSRVLAWTKVIDRVKNHLSKWKMKALSIGGRLTLLKSVLGSMPIFHMSIFRVPLSVLRTLESIRSHFFNAHDLNSKKASWRFNVQMGVEVGNVGANVKTGTKSCWMNIVHEINVLCKRGINLLEYMHDKIGNGNKTTFWEDNWIGGKILKIHYPRLYALEADKLITVGMKLTQPSLVSSFRQDPWGDIEQEQFNDLYNLVQDAILALMDDRWKWELESLGDFSVASVRKVIEDKTLPEVDSKTRWIKYVPIKVNVHAWKVKTNSIPTRFNVSRRGIGIESIMCAICDNGPEMSSHLFFSCCMVRQIARLITRW
ncbi:RNA-directed DNA polymerase, eukaryota, reverse transcriptase zinc-binding domain protein [Tanacetum coccineum]